MRNVKAIAGVADVLESRGFKAEKAKRSSMTSPNGCMVNLETGYEPEYPIESTPVKAKSKICQLILFYWELQGRRE